MNQVERKRAISRATVFAERFRALWGGEAGDPMPTFVLKAKDDLAPIAVMAYLVACDVSDLDEQKSEVTKALREIQSWRDRNRGLCKLPDHKHVPVR